MIGESSKTRRQDESLQSPGIKKRETLKKSRMRRVIATALATAALAGSVAVPAAQANPLADLFNLVGGISNGISLLLDGTNDARQHETVVDGQTYDGWQSTSISSTQNVGRIWTDKSVWNGDADLAQEGEGAHSTTVKKGNSDFLVGLSALSSTSKVTTTEVQPLDIVLVLDTSLSMDEGFTHAYTKIYGSDIDTKASNQYFLIDGEYRLAQYSPTYFKEYDGWGYVDDNNRDISVKVKASSSDWQGKQMYRYDVSGTQKSKLLKDAVNGFIDKTAQQNASITDPDQRAQISLVQFSASDPNDTDVQYGEYRFSQGSKIVRELTDCYGNNVRSLKNAVNGLLAGGSTHAEKGMDLAKDVLTGSDRDNAKKVVVFFTDGEPTGLRNFDSELAEKAVTAASQLKASGATIYTIGVFDGADAGKTTDQMNAYMHAMSSNYQAGVTYEQVMNDDAKRVEGSNYYYVVSDESGFESVFDGIYSQIVNSSGSPIASTGGAGNTPGYITFTDKLGDYMQVDDFKTILLAGGPHDVTESGRTSNNNGVTTITYKSSGTVTANGVYGNTDLSRVEITVTHTEDVDGKPAKNGDKVEVRIPADLMPMRNFEVKADGTMTVTDAYPIFLFYGVSLKDGVEDLVNNPDQDMKDYIDWLNNKSGIKNDAGKVSFQSNYYSKMEVGTDAQGKGRTVGDTTATFTPADSNGYYYTAQDSQIYTDSKCNDAATERDINQGSRTFYFKTKYYEFDGGYSPTTDGKLQGKYKEVESEPVAFTADLSRYPNAWYKKDGVVYLNKGGARTTVLNDFHIEGKNNTGTAAMAIDPQWQDESQSLITVHLGNNGKIVMDQGQTLSVFKNVAAGEGQDASQIAADKSFEFTLKLTDANGTALVGPYKAQVYNEKVKIDDEFELGNDETFTLKNGEHLEVYGLPTGTKYTVTEKEVENYKADKAEQKGAISSDDVTKNSVTFTNTYTAKSTRLSAKGLINYEKQFVLADDKSVSAWDTLDDATFNIRLEGQINDDTPEGITADNMPMPEENDEGDKYDKKIENGLPYVEVTATKYKPNGNFGDIEFTRPGTYTYSVYEKTPSDDDSVLGVDYSEALFKIDVEVVDQNGTLSVKGVTTRRTSNTSGELVTEPVITENKATFRNEYSPGTTYAALYGDKFVNAYGELVKPAQHQFTFLVKAIDSDGTPLMDATNAGEVMDSDDKPARALGYQDETTGVSKPLEYDSRTGSWKVQNETNGSIVLGRAEFTVQDKDKSFYYEIREAKGSDARFTYDENTVWYARVDVSVENRDGEDFAVAKTVYNKSLEKLRNGDVAGNAARFSFTNGYEAASATTQLSIQKTLTGRDWTNDAEAAFDVKYTGYVGDYKSVGTITDQSVKVTKPAQGNVGEAKTGDITFDRPGTYTFSITENANDSSMPYVNYPDTHTATATVVVRDDGSGKLNVASATYSNADAPADSAVTDKAAFTNAYADTYTTPNTGLVTLEKTLTGRTMKAEEFTFEVKAADGDAADKLGGQTKEYKNAATTQTAPKFSTGLFADMTFTQADVGKAFKYAVTEKAGAKDKGVEYDSSEYTVTLTPRIGDDNKVTVDVSIQKVGTGHTGATVSFTNTYTPTPIEFDLSIFKTLYGRDWQSGEQFSFVDNNDATRTATVTASQDSPYKAGVPVEVSLGKVTFTKAGEYTYSISETVPPGAVNNVYEGVTYDSTARTIKVKVTDDGEGKLTAAYVNPDSRNFYNRYSVSSISLDSVVSISAEKTLSGATLKADDFTFNISEKGDGTLNTKQVKNDANGGISLPFAKTTYTKDDDGKTFTYTVSEDAPESDEANPGITYDDAKHTVVVKPFDNGKGAMSLEVEVDGKKVAPTADGSVPQIEFAFTNSYEANSQTGLTLEAHKAYEGGTLKGDDFEFVLKDKDGNPVATAKNDAQGDVKFGDLKFTTAAAKDGFIPVAGAQKNDDGDYVFNWTMVETSLSSDTMAASPVTYPVTVTVTDKGDGTLEAEVTGAPKDGYTFTNFSPEKTAEVESKAEGQADGTAYVGQELTYTISYFNNTAGKQNITITDNVPTGTEYVSAENGGDHKDGVVTWVINDVKPGTRDKVSFKVKVTQGALNTDVENTATVQIGENDSKVEVKTNPTTVTVPTGSLKVTKVVAGDNADPDAEYEMKVKLTAADSATPITGPFGDVTFDNNGETTFKLKKDGSKTIEGLPAGAKCKVTELTKIEGWTVAYTNDEGTIPSGVTPVEVTVTNTTAGTVSTAEGQLDVTKVLEGCKWNTGETFTFQLKDKDDKDGKSIRVATATSDTKTARFAPLVFSKAGTYEYVVTEAKPADDARDKRMEYSDAVYRVKVTVSGKTDDTAGLVAKVEYSTDGQDWSEKNNMTFTNVYTPESQPKKDVALATDTTKASVNGKLVGVGDELVYTIDWKNDAVDESGKAVAADVTITDELPDGLEFVSADNNGKLEDSVIKWVINADAGKSGAVTFKAKVSNKALSTKDGSIVNAAEVKVGENAAKQSTKATVYVPQKHQEIDNKPVTTSSIKVGDLITYKIDWRNDEKTAATVVVTDAVPDGTELVADSIDNGGMADENNKNITWTFNNVDSGKTGTVSFTVRVTEDALVGKGINNQAAVKIGKRSTQIKTNTETLPEPQAGSVKVTKTVTADKSLTAPDATFTLQLAMVDAADKPLTGSYGYTVHNSDGTKAGNPVINFFSGLVNGVTGGNQIKSDETVTLKADQYVRVDGLPEGAQVSVTEQNIPAGFTNTSANNQTATVVTGDEPVAITVANKYAVDELDYNVSTGLSIQKKLGGREAFANETFAFTMTAKDNAPEPSTPTIQVAPGAATAANFGTITFTKPGEYTYTVAEVAGSELSMTYAKPQTVTYKVENNNDGTLKVASIESEGEAVDALTFTNTLATGGLTVSKTVDPGDSGVAVDKLDDKFTFTVSFEDTTGSLNGKYGDVTFNSGKATDTFELANGGAKEYTGLPQGVTYTVTEADKDGFTLTDVAVNGKSVEGEQKAANGTITANASAVVFTNTFTPGSVEFDPNAEANVPVTKKFEGGTLETGKFSFTMTVTDADGKTVDEQKDVKNAADGTVNFSKLTFSKAGTYTVTVHENAPKDRGSIFYDEHTLTYDIVVTRVGSRLDADMDENTIDGSNTFTNVQGKKTVEAPKDGIKLGDELTYTITWANTTGKVADVVITDELPEGLTFVDAGPGYHRFDGSTNTVTWNLNKQAAGTGGTVTVTATVNEKAFGNKGVTNSAAVTVGDRPEVTLTSETVKPKTTQLTVAKMVETKNGAAIDTNKTFNIDVTLTGPDGKTPLTGTYKVGDKDVTVDKGGKLTLELKHGESKIITGIPSGATYAVSEDAEALKAEGYVAPKAQAGTIATDGSTKVAVTNTYAPGSATFDPSGTTEVAVTKELTDGELTADQFAFDLTVANDKGEMLDDMAQTAKNDAEGKVTFNPLTFSKTGTYTVTIKEQLPGDRGSVYYDEHTFSYKINVSSDGSANLKTELVKDSATGAPKFTNVQGKKYSTDLREGGVPQVGDEFSYNITWANRTGGNAKVVITDELAKGLTYVSASADATAVAVEGQKVTIDLGEQASGERGSVSIKVRVNEDALIADKINNTATVQVGDRPVVTVSADPLSKPKTGELTVKKTVASGDKNRDFTFTVALAAGDAPLAGTYHYKDAAGKTQEFTGGTATVTLRHGQSVTFTDLPQGATYKVAEQVPAGYGYTAQHTEGTISGTPATASFINTYGEGVGDVTYDTAADFTKVFEGRAWTADDTFTFTISGEDGAPLPATTSVAVNGEGATKAEGSERYSKDFGFGEITYTLANLNGIEYGKDGTRSRTFTYAVTETAGELAGVAYDTHTAKLSVTLTDNGTGQLSTNTTTSVVSDEIFTNTFKSTVDYTMAASGIDISKVLTGRDMTAGQFAWTVKAAEGSEDLLGIDGQQVTSDAAKNGQCVTMPVTFTDKQITSDDALAGKAWSYTVSETKGGAAGYTNDPAVYTVTITPTFDVQTGMLTVTTTVMDADGNQADTRTVTSTDAADATGSVTLPFTNGYAAQPATLGGDGEVAIAATKQLMNVPLGDNQFGFAVTNALDKAAEPTVLATGSNAADGSVSFSGITYTTEQLEADVAAGLAARKIATDGSYAYIYNYLVAENDPAAGSGISAKTPAQPACVTVTDAGDGGKLAISVAYPAGADHLAFVNVYGEGAEDSVTVAGVKTLDYARASLRGNATADTASIAGKYTFTITGVDEDGKSLPDELMPAAKSVTNDATGAVDFGKIAYTMDSVFGAMDKAEAEARAKAAAEAEAAVKAEAEAAAAAKAEAAAKAAEETEADALAGDAENGEAAVENGEAEQVDGAATQAETATDEQASDADISAKAAAAAAKAAAEAVNDTKPRTRTFTYTVTESGSVAGVTNDAAATKTFTVTVTDHRDGTLSATTSYGTGKAFSFTNIYDVSGVTSDPTGPGNLTVTKVLKGAEGTTRVLRAGEFSFALIERAADGMETVVSQGVNDALGNVALSPIAFGPDSLGTHTYELREVEGTAGGVAYDGSVRTLTATVADNGDGTLRVTWAADGELTFTNTYEARSTGLTFNAAKVLVGRDLVDGEFEFELIQDGKKVSSAKNAADGSVAFEPVKFTAAGEHDFEIREVAGDEANVTYDDTVFTYHVTVTDDGEGRLSVAWTVGDAGAPVFCNVYTEPGEPAVPAEPVEPATPVEPVETRDDEPQERMPASGDNSLFDAAVVAGAAVATLGAGAILRRKDGSRRK